MSHDPPSSPAEVAPGNTIVPAPPTLHRPVPEGHVDLSVLQTLPAGTRRLDGRAALVEMLDILMAKNYNMQLMAAAMQEELQADPMKFFKEVAMPLTPSSMLSREKKDTPEDLARGVREALGGMVGATLNVQVTDVAFAPPPSASPAAPAPESPQ